MSIDRIIRCDECELTGPPEFIANTTEGTRRLAKMEGWECRGRGADVCPDCVVAQLRTIRAERDYY